MNDKEDDIEIILKRAMENGGKVSYGNTVFSEAMYNRRYLTDINSGLLRFGILYGLSKDGTWDEFEINRTGKLFIENGGFEGERKDKLQNIADLELDRNSKRSTIHSAGTAIHTLNVAVVSAVLSLIALLIGPIYTKLSCIYQGYATVLLIVLSLVSIFLLVREVLAARKGLIKDSQNHNIP